MPRMPDQNGVIVEPIQPTNGVRKLATAFISGGAVALVLAAITTLIALGGERRDTLDKVALVPALHDELSLHRNNGIAHLDQAEANAITNLPVQLSIIQLQLARVENNQNELQRQLYALGRKP